MVTVGHIVRRHTTSGIVAEHVHGIAAGMRLELQSAQQ